MPLRSHHCGQLRTEHVGQTVQLAGWVNNYRDHGGVRFIDLRDREGLTQVVFHPEAGDAHALAQKLRHEDVVAIEGKCIVREGGPNPKLPTGEVEVDATACVVLNKSDTPPFQPDEAHKTNEEVRLRHRYVDLRRPGLQKTLRTRHRVTKIMRDYYDELGFTEVETPFLCRSTPEGARDYLVPARLHPGSFYALPQSPRLFKQILMVGGVEKYFQIARCFRDEDPRADRQAEFTQLDVEMSFVDQDEVMTVHEELVRRIWKQVLDVDVPAIPRMTYDEAMARYGSDRPDLRFGLELVDVTDLATQTDFKVFKGAVDKGGIVKCIRVPGGAKLTRKDTDGLAEWVKQFGAGGLPVVKVENGELSTGVAKFLEPIKDALLQRLNEQCGPGCAEGDLICFGVDSKPATVHRVLGELRVHLAREAAFGLDLIKPGQWQWLWVVDFPLVEWNDEAGRWDSLHHPFTSPSLETFEQLAQIVDSGDREQIAGLKSRAYDLVLNGSELGGGSIRIHRTDWQAKIFELFGLDADAAREKFGFLLDALRYGAPPHGGIAFGLDRIVMHLAATTNIRDVIAFPKTQNGFDLMTQAPGPVEEDQLKELHIRLAEQEPATP